jgi:hypothetical protein
VGPWVGEMAGEVGAHLGQRGGGALTSEPSWPHGRPVGRRCRWGRSEGEGGAVDEVSNGRAMLFDAGPRKFCGQL